MLVHGAKKPTKACARLVVSHFAERGAVVVDIARDPRTLDEAPPDDRPPVLAVVGDRHSTDVLLGERIRDVLRPSGVGPDPVVTILTTRLWRRSKPGIALLRLLERALARLAAWRVPADRRLAMAQFADCVNPIVSTRAAVTSGRDRRALVPRTLLAVGFRRPLVWRGVRDWRQLGWTAGGVSSTPSQAERLATMPLAHAPTFAPALAAAVSRFRHMAIQRVRPTR